MTTPDIQQAREWAEDVRRIEAEYGSARPDALAGASIIESLPDQWIDAEKVRELLHWREVIEQTPIRSTEAHLIALLHALLTPSLPTLADMTPEERQACQWMQCVDAEGDGSHGVIWMISEDYLKVAYPNGVIHSPSFEDITPLPDLPRLEWPGSGDAPTVAEQENVAPDQVVAKDICNNEEESLPRPEGVPAQEAPNEETPPAEMVNNPSSGHSADLPRPEDVPAGEAWLVGIRTGNGTQNDQKFFGIRSSGGTWELFDVDEGWHSRWGIPSDITLISRLVPEVAP